MLQRTLVGPLLVSCALALPCIGRADPLPLTSVPEPLKPWTAWVLRGQESAACPLLAGSESEVQCLWPSRLELDLGAKGGRFSQSTRAFAVAWLALPGDESRWPLDVKVD